MAAIASPIESSRKNVELVRPLWQAAMPSSDKNKLKDLYLASCLAELNKKAEPDLPADRNVNPST